MSIISDIIKLVTTVDIDKLIEVISAIRDLIQLIKELLDTPAMQKLADK